MGFFPRRRTPAADLHALAQAGDAAGLEKALRKDRSRIDARGSKGETPLHRACGMGHLAAARVLLEHDADLRAVDEAGNMPLHRACAAGQVEVARALLEAGADPIAPGANGLTPKSFAALSRNADLVKLFS